MMPKIWKKSSIKSSDNSVGNGEEAGAKIIDVIVSRMDLSEKTAYREHEHHRYERAPMKGMAPRKRYCRRMLQNGRYEAVVAAAKLTITPTGDHVIAVDLCVQHAGKTFKLAATWAYSKFCQLSRIEEKPWNEFDEFKIVGTIVQCAVVIEPPNDSCPHFSNYVKGYLPSLFD
jgi:hypothetical protein